MIAMLLSSSSVLLANEVTEVPLRGNFVQSDTTVVMNINLIRKANAKMIERNHFKTIIEQQDSIIADKDKYIKVQTNVISLFHHKVVDKENEIISLKERIDKEHAKRKHVTYSLGGIILGIITASLVF